MLTHKQIWSAIDALATRNRLSPSGLAKLAGLDPTTFNKSKRGAPTGKLRWPSTESLSKILSATGASLAEFVALIDGEKPAGKTVSFVPLVSMKEAAGAGIFTDAGHPATTGWDSIPFPELADEHAYALEVTGDDLLPVFRDGDRVIASPAASLRRADRVVVRTKAGEILVAHLARLTAQRVELKPLDPTAAEREYALTDIAFVHRIVWASQ